MLSFYVNLTPSASLSSSIASFSRISQGNT
jgi:hypothetical protein